MIKLKELREERDVLQKDLAAAINRTRACISSWEQGKTEPSIDDLVKLADFFGTSVDSVIGRSIADEREARPKTEIELLDEFRKLDENDKYRTLGYVQALAQRENETVLPRIYNNERADLYNKERADAKNDA